MEKYTVTWIVYEGQHRGTSTESGHTAGPFQHRQTAERFAAGLAETIGPRLGNVQIVTVETDNTRKEG
jgi:hypothetical protein